MTASSVRAVEASSDTRGIPPDLAGFRKGEQDLGEEANIKQNKYTDYRL